MNEDFQLSLKWFVAMSFMFSGIFLLWLGRDMDGVPPLLYVAVMCFGVCFWMTSTWLELRQKMAVIGLAVFAVVGALAYVTFIEIPYFLICELWLLVLGVPAMAFVFHKYSN